MFMCTHRLRLAFSFIHWEKANFNKTIPLRLSNTVSSTLNAIRGKIPRTVCLLLFFSRYSFSDFGLPLKHQISFFSAMIPVYPQDFPYLSKRMDWNVCLSHAAANFIRSIHLSVSHVHSVHAERQQWWMKISMRSDRSLAMTLLF